MSLYYNINLNVAMFDFHNLKILGVSPSLLYFILFLSLFLLCYLILQPFVALLISRHTVNLLTYLMSSLFMIVSCFILLHLSKMMPFIYEKHWPIIFKNALLAIGTIGIVIAGYYYTKHLLKLK